MMVVCIMQQNGIYQVIYINNMNSIFKICNSNNCGVLILGLEKDCNEYSVQDFSEFRKYKYNQSITVNVVRGIEYSNNDPLQPIYTSQEVDIIVHSPTSIDESNITLPKDGLYEVSHIILPTQEYQSDSDYSNGFYFYDTIDQNFKKYNQESVEIVELDEILQINQEQTTIIRSDKLTFSICKLNQCFYFICRNLLSSFCGKCINKLNNPKQDVYNRDIIWMAINVISYLVEAEQYFEALRILQTLTESCGSAICKNINIDAKGGGCGCS